jgi:hypothetical protein
MNRGGGERNKWLSALDEAEIFVGEVFRLAHDGGQTSNFQALKGDGLGVENESTKEGTYGRRCCCATQGHCWRGCTAEWGGGGGDAAGGGGAGDRPIGGGQEAMDVVVAQEILSWGV